MDVSIFHRLSLFIILIAGTYLYSQTAFSRDGYLYEVEFSQLGQSYLDLLDGLPTDDLQKLPADKRAACVSRYQGILNDGLIDIRFALGYFDWTTGGSVDNYGLSPSMDIGAFAALSDLLTSRCTGNLRLCGFKQDSKNPYLFYREVIVFGQRYTARIEMHFASVTEYYSKNIGSYKTQQVERTQFMDAFFANSLQTADAVFYFGHSRNGGGPDFAPPRLNSANKVDYRGYYEVYRPGLKKLLTALSDPNHQTKIFGLMSCDSRDHFLQKIRNVAPQTGVITSTAVLNVDQVYTAMLGAADALLRGQCQKSFYQELRMTPENREFITMDGMFE